MIINGRPAARHIFYCLRSPAQLLQKAFRRFHIPAIAQRHLPCSGPSPVPKHTPHNGKSLFPFRQGKSRHIILLLLCRNPQPLFQIKGPPATIQLLQPFHGNLQLSCGQIPLRHKQGMQLIFIFWQPFPLLHTGKLLIPWPYKPRLPFQGLLHCRMNPSGGRRIVVHHGGLLAPLQRQGHGGSALRVNLPHNHFAGLDLFQQLPHPLHVPELFHAFPSGLPDQGMIRLAHHLIQHFRTPKSLHPQRLPSISPGPHHQSSSAVIAERHVKNRRLGQQSGENRRRGLRMDPRENPLRQNFLSIGVEQKPVFLIHVPHVLAHLL